jgi:hypothetical protein
MAVPARVTLVKEFSYRGVPEEWSNTYGLSGPAFPDYNSMLGLVSVLATAEANVYLAPCKCIRALIYQPGSVVADRTVDLQAELGGPKVGALAVGSNAQEWAGDQAAWIRGKIGVNSKGRAVYVRKYFHAGASEAEGDATIVQWRTAAAIFADQLTNGSLPNQREWVGPDGENVSMTAVSQWVTTRTLKRRGRRPTSP